MNTSETKNDIKYYRIAFELPNNEQINNIVNKLNSDSTEFNSDDSESDFSDFYNNKNTHFNDFRKESDFNCLFYLENENDNLKPNKSNDDYIQTFIQNFNRKGSYINDLDFTINDINNIYHDNKINNNN